MKKVYASILCVLLLTIWGSSLVLAYNGDIPSQSVVSCPNTALAHPGENLLDGRGDTFWRIRPDAQEGWVTLEFAAASLVDGVYIEGVLMPNSQLVLEYEYDGYWNPIVGGVLHELPANGFIDLSYTRIVAEKIRIRLRGADAQASSIAELKIYGQQATSVLHRIEPVEMLVSDASSAFHPLKHLFDGNTKTTWNTNSHYEEVIISLDEQYRLDHLHLFFSEQADGTFYLDARTEEGWHELVTITEYPKGEWHKVDVSSFNLVTNYVRLRVNGSGEALGGLGELELWGYGEYQGRFAEAVLSDTQFVMHEPLNLAFEVSGNLGWNENPQVPHQSLQVLYKSTSLNQHTTSLQHNIRLVNTGVLPIDLSSVVLRYWYTAESTSAQVAEIYWSNIGQSNVTTTFVPLDSAMPKADRYLEIGFTEQAGILGPQTEIELHLGIHAQNWEMYDQSNDHSFHSDAKNYVENLNYTGYINDFIAWGDEPKEQAEVALMSTAYRPTMFAMGGIAEPELTVLYTTKNTQEFTNSIQHNVQLVNSGSTPIDLASVRLRYWYNNEPFKEQMATIYWSNIGQGNVNTRFVELEKYIPEANQYLELGFSNQAGVLQPGMTVEIHLGFNTFDWSNYNQYNDYSYDLKASNFVENLKYTAYIEDRLNWGQEPKGLGAGDLGGYRMYALDLVVEGEKDRSLYIELNGKTIEVAPSFVKRDQTFYQKVLPDEYLKAGMNSLRLMPDGLGITVNHLQVTSYTRDGVVPLLSGKYQGNPLRFTPSTTTSEVPVLFTQTSLLGEVHVFSSDFEGSVFAYVNHQWVQVPQIKKQKGMHVFASPVVTDQIRIWNPSHAVIEAVEVLGSPVSDQNPILHILEPTEDAIIDLSKGDIQLIGFVDDSQASIEVNGRAVPLRGHYFSVPLKQLGLLTGQENRIAIVARDRQGRQSIVERMFYIGSSLRLELDQTDEWILTDEPYFTLSGRVERDSVQVYVNDQQINVHNKGFSTVVSLQEGFNTFVVRAVDQQSGAIAKTIRQVVYQKPFIQLTVDEPLHGSFVNQDSVIVTGRVEASRTATVTVNGSLVDLAQGRFRSAEVSLVEGDNSITIRAEDSKGLVDEETIVVHYDSKAPELSDITPLASYITADTKVRFTGKVWDINPVRVFVNGHVVPVEGGFFTLDLTMLEGFHDVEIQAQDLAGNLSSYIIENIIVDLTPPENFAVFADPKSWTSNTQPILTFSTTDAISGMSHYEFSMYGQPYITVESPFRIPHLADGKHEVRIKAVDQSGRETVSRVTVYIDTTPPETPEIFRVIPGNGRMVLKWDPSSPDTVEYRVEEGDGQLYTVTETELVLPDVPNGAVLEFRVWAVDRAGNEGAPTDWKQGTIGVAEAIYDPEQGAIVEYDTAVLVMPNIGLPEGVREIQVTEITSEYLEEQSMFPAVSPIYEFSAFMEGEDTPLENLTINSGYFGQISYDPSLIPEGFPEQNLDVYYYDSLFGRWMLIESSAVDVENDTIYFLTNHFTSFVVKASLISDLTPQEYKDAGYSPLKAYSTHEGVSVSPQGGTASTRQTELVLPGVNGFDLILERRYDTATARADSASLDLNIKIGFNLFSASGLLSPKEILKSVEIYRTDLGLAQTFLDMAEKYISQQGDYAYSMGNGWRLNIPYIKTNNSALMVVLPDGSMHSMSEMDLVSFITLPGARILRMEQHEGENFTLDIEQVQGVFPAIDANDKLTLKSTWSGIKYTLTLSDGTTYVMDAFGRTTKMIDPSGLQEINFHYNGSFLSYIEDTVGRRVRFAYELTTPWSWPRISKIWVENDPSYQREIQYGRGYDGTLAWAKDVAGRTSRYEYDLDLMFGGTAGVKINIASMIIRLLGSQIVSEKVSGTLFSIFGIHDIELFGSLSAQLIHPLKQVEAVGQGVVTIGYEQPTVVYGSAKVDWFFVLPTSITFSLNLQQRLLASEVSVREAKGGPLVKKTTFDYAINYHSEGQPFIKKTEEYDGAKRIVYHYTDLTKTRKRWEDGYKKLDLPEGIPIDASIWFPVRFWNKEIVPLNTRTEIYQGQGDWLLEVHETRWDQNRLRPLEQTVWRGDHYQKLTYAYDNWGNVTHLTDYSEVHGRVNKLERWTHYANTQSSPGSSQPWRTSPYSGQTIKKERRNLPLGELVANYAPTENGSQAVTYLQTNYRYNERGQRLASSRWDGEEWLEDQFTYDPRTGSLIEHKNSNDHRTLYEYDEHGFTYRTH